MQVNILHQVEFLDDGKTVYIYFHPASSDFMKEQIRLRDVFFAAGYHYKDAHREQSNKITVINENKWVYYWELEKK